MPESSLAFLSNGKLHVRKDGAVRVVESEFERTVRERAASIERRHAWKRKGSGAAFMGHTQVDGPQNIPPALITGITAGNDGSLLYSMETEAVSGIFLLDAAGLETRLFHTADFRIRHASLNSEGDRLAATIFHKDSTRSNIGVLPVHGTDFSELTEGDSLDQLPRWVPGPKRRIVFQSAGVGRDLAGRFAGLGPCAIQQLDCDTGDLDEIAADKDRDLLHPCQTGDGALFYIRKPYETRPAAVSLAACFRDAALFPFRMAGAIFQYFNVFSMLYTGKPLVTSRGAVQRRMDPRQLFIYGNLASARQAMEAADGDDSQPLAPATWELVKRSPGGQTEVLAKNVLAFDVARDGSVFYTDGSGVTLIDCDGRPQRLFKAQTVAQIVSL